MRFYRAQQISGHHRGDEACAQQGHEHGGGDGQAELLEVLANNTAHKRDRREDRDDGHRNRDDGEANFISGFERGAIGRFAHVHVPDDVLDLDNRIVDQDTCHERQRQQADKVQRESKQADEPERRDRRQRQGNRRNQRGANIF